MYDRLTMIHNVFISKLKQSRKLYAVLHSESDYLIETVKQIILFPF